MDAINEQSWLFPPSFPPWGGLPVKSSTVSTFVPVRVTVIVFAGEDWPDCKVVAPGRCELWLRLGLVRFRGHLGLSRVRVGCPSPACFASCLPSRLLREVAGGDDWQQGAEQRDAGRESEILSGRSGSSEVECVLMPG